MFSTMIMCYICKSFDCVVLAFVNELTNHYDSRNHILKSMYLTFIKLHYLNCISNSMTLVKQVSHLNNFKMCHMHDYVNYILSCMI